MARHNFLIQRHIKGPNNGQVNGPNDDWCDGGTGSRKHRDGFGNEGFATLAQARADIKYLRKRYPEYQYRIIQIVS